jgi:hypothetical protein
MRDWELIVETSLLAAGKTRVSRNETVERSLLLVDESAFGRNNGLVAGGVEVNRLGIETGNSHF